MYISTEKKDTTKATTHDDGDGDSGDGDSNEGNNPMYSILLLTMKYINEAAACCC